MKTGVSDEPYSLMLGYAGDICFIMDVIMGVGKFPGFDFWINHLALFLKIKRVNIFILNAILTKLNKNPFEKYFLLKIKKNNKIN